MVMLSDRVPPLLPSFGEGRCFFATDVENSSAEYGDAASQYGPTCVYLCIYCMQMGGHRGVL